MQNLIHKIEALTEIDIYPVLDHLDQFKNSTNKEEQKYYLQDQKRLEEYNQGKWVMLRVFAAAEIHIPLSGYSQQTFMIQKISTSGLFGIESDSNENYILEEKQNQLSELKDLLISLNCDMTNFKKLLEAANNV